MQDEEYKIDVDVAKLVVIGACSVLILTVILLGTHGYYLKVANEQHALKFNDSVSPLVKLVNEKAELNLNKYYLLDQATGTAQLPIDRAIEVMAANKGVAPTTQPLGR